MATYGQTLDALAREGAIAELWDGRTGHWNGLINGNDGTPSAACRQISPGGPWVFPNTTDEVTVADHASLRLTAGSIVVVSERGFTSQTSNEYLYSHASATPLQFYLSSSGLRIFDGTSTRILNTSILGKHSIGASMDHTGTPVGYADGATLGNFSGPVNMVAGASPTTLGGNSAIFRNLKSPLSAVLIANRILTPTEMAAVHAELLALRWPSKQYSHGLARQQANSSQAGIVAGWDMKPVNGTVIDRVGGFTGTLSGNPTYERGILGDRMRFDGVDDYVGVSNDAAISLGASNMTLRAWIKLASLPGTINRIFSKETDGNDREYTLGITDAGELRYSMEKDNAGEDVASGGTILVDKWSRVAATLEASSKEVNLYVDGGWVASTTLTVLPDVFTADLALGTLQYLPGTYNFDGIIACPEIYNRTMSANEILADYLQGARAVQFATDWGYPISAANEGGTLHGQIGGLASPFRAGDTTGRWAVETDTVDGKLAKVLTCKTAGVVYVDTAHFYDCTPTEAAHGTVEAWMYKADASILTWKFVGSDLDATANGYAFVWAADESVVISELGVGNVIAGGTATADAWHCFRNTLSGAGAFNAYIDKTTFGSGADTTITTSTRLLWDMDAGDKICLSPFPVLKMLGEVAP